MLQKYAGKMLAWQKYVESPRENQAHVPNTAMPGKRYGMSEVWQIVGRMSPSLHQTPAMFVLYVPPAADYGVKTDEKFLLLDRAPFSFPPRIRLILGG